MKCNPYEILNVLSDEELIGVYNCSLSELENVHKELQDRKIKGWSYSVDGNKISFNVEKYG